MPKRFSKEMLEKLASDLWKSGYDCSEVMVRVYSTLGIVQGVDLTTLNVLAKGFGNGLGAKLGDCGALSGAVLILSAVTNSSINNRKKIYKTIGDFSKKFKEEFGDCNCSIIREKSKSSCKNITVQTVLMLADYISNEINI